VTRRRWGLLAIGVAGIAWIALGEWISITHHVPENHVLDAAVGLSWLAAGLVIADRQPGNRLGPLMIVYALLLYINNVSNSGNAIFVSLAGVPNLSITAALFVHVVLAYPTGRLSSRLDAAYVWLLYIVNITWALVWVLTFDPVAFGICAGCPEPALAYFPNAEVIEALVEADPWFTWPFTAALIALMVRRFARASRAERRLLAPLWLVSFLTSAVFLINNTVAYTAPTGELERILRDLNYVGVIAVPLVMLWGLLERRLARSAAGDLLVRLERPLPSDELRAAIGAALHDPELAVAFPREGAEGWVDERGVAVDLDAIASRRTVSPVERDGVTLAVLVHDPALDPELVRATSAAAAMALENARLQAEIRAQLDEVRASRTRIVQAGDEERRRLERDLHDGAQQRLLALAFALRSAQRRVDGQADPDVRALLGEADEELGVAIAELRDLAHGIHPAILTEEGLGPAIESLGQRSAAPVRIEATPDRRLAPAIEAAAYFVVSEALTNATKHAEGVLTHIEARVSNGSLLVEVRDEGRGGADPSRGSGLRGLEDRVAAVGGTLRIESFAGAGTRVIAEIPCG
jgi:signal transduction histidine kinase